MDKSFLEKRINGKAEERFHEDMRGLVDYIYNHPIGRKLKIKIGEKEIPLVNFGRNYGIINQEPTQDYSRVSDVINIIETKGEVTEIYKQEETEVILKKLDNISYLFEEVGY